MGWNAEARITALLFSVSAAAFLLLARAVLLQPQRHGGGGMSMALAALDRFLGDGGRGLLDLATRRNMVLLCNAILLLILRDAGVLRRGASTGASAIVNAADDSDSEQGVVVWRRSRNSDVAAHDANRQRPLPRGPRPAETAPALAGPSQEEEEPAASKQIVLLEEAATNQLVGHDRAAAVELEQLQAAASASATEDGDSIEFDRRNAVGDDGGRNASTVTERTEEEVAVVELADDRRIEEFIAKQWSKMRQESLQLVIRSSSGYQHATIRTIDVM